MDRRSQEMKNKITNRVRVKRELWKADEAEDPRKAKMYPEHARELDKIDEEFYKKDKKHLEGEPDDKS